MKLTVNATKKYDIVSFPSFKLLAEEMKKNVRGKNVLIVSDDNVAPLYLKKASDALVGFSVHTFVFQAGEKSKNVDTYLKIIGVLAEKGFVRQDCVLALGGGVVGDVAGFAAATYMRGISFVQCPTSFLAMIDSSVGGKTAVDLPQGKNLLGAFYQPDLVYIALETLRTLPEREVRCGMGEAVKYAFLSDSISPELLKKGITEELIFKCLKIKADVVEKDEFDKGTRAFLNLGHTLGHAVEKLSGFSLSHGECVVKGLSKIIDMSVKNYSLSEEKKQEMVSLLALSGTEPTLPFDLAEVLKETVHDKKRERGGVNFVLLKDIGEPVSVLLTAEEAEALLL